MTGDIGRLEVWKTALEIISSHPVTGVGANCFGMAFGSNRGDEGRVPVWKAVQNSYLQIATEVGLMVSLCLGNGFPSFVFHYVNSVPPEQSLYPLKVFLKR